MKNPANKSNITKSTLIFPSKKQLQNSIKKQVVTRENIIVAISWGADSMLTAVLIYNFFITNKYSLQNLFFVHFNHKIRSASTQEEKFIKEYFSGVNLLCIPRTWSTKNSTESSLRWRRYVQLQKLVKKHNIDRVVLGHNLSDRIESTFLNILRGASLKGFLSMDFAQSHPLLTGAKVMRPLISLSKKNILEICKKNNIPYITDKSNFDNTTSLRNKLRNKILPQLFALNKNENSQKTFENSMENIYTEINKLQARGHRPQATNTMGLGAWGLRHIPKSPYRKASFAYQRDTKQNKITIENIIKILNTLGIYNNISSVFLKELTTFLQTAKNWHKYFQKTYFFVAHGKIYIISAPKDFRKKHITNKDLDKWYRYPRETDRYKGKTRNQYCITQKIPVFWRNFTSILEKDKKIVKVIKPSL